MLIRKPEADVPLSGKTDWARLRTMTDADIEQAVADDPDAAPILTDEQMRRDYKPHPPRIPR